MNTQLGRGINFENALRCKEFLKIINKACQKYKKNIDSDELKQIKRISLWKSLVKYKKDKKCKFKTYLYHTVRWACGNYLSKSYKKNNNVSLDNFDVVDNKNYFEEAENKDFFLQSIKILDEKEKEIIKLRFFDKKTLQELSDINGFTKQWNRICIIKILKKIKSGVTK